jgi:uncharacterized damage-inducible protein DinB
MNVSVDGWKSLYEKVAQLIDKYSNEDWAKPSRYEGWSNKDLLAHIVTTQRSIPLLVDSAFNPQRYQNRSSEPFDPDRWNASQIRKKQLSTPSELAREMLDSVQALETIYREKLNDDTLHMSVTAGPTPGAPIEKVIEDMFNHQKQHLKDLEDSLSGC